MTQAILPLFLVLAFAFGAAAAPSVAPQEEIKSPEAFSAALAGDWSELQLGILIPDLRELMGVKIRRLNKPFSLRFTIQVIRGDESGAESPIAFEKVNELLRDTVTHYRAAHAASNDAKRASTEVRGDADAKHSRATMVMKVSGAGIDLSTMTDVGTRFVPYCEWLGSLAALAPAPASPGEPPEKVEAMLRGNWNELEVAVGYWAGCIGPREATVTFTRAESGMRAQFVHTGTGIRRIEHTTDVAEREIPVIAAKVLQLYQAAFKEHVGDEESIGEAVSHTLSSEAQFTREGRPLDPQERFRKIVLRAKIGGSTKHFENEMCDPSALNWISQYELPRASR